MRIQINIKVQNKDTGEEELKEITLYKDNIACLYQDTHGVAITTKQGKFYRVDNTLKQLKGLL